MTIKRYHGQLTCHADLVTEYSPSEGDLFPRDDQVIFACYSYEDYSGYATVVWRDDAGNLHMQEDSHCSCNGLEGYTFSEIVSTIESIKMSGAYTGNSYYGDICHVEFRVCIDAYEKGGMSALGCMTDDQLLAAYAEKADTNAV